MHVKYTVKIQKKWVNKDYEFVIYELPEIDAWIGSSTYHGPHSNQGSDSDPVSELISSIFDVDDPEMGIPLRSPYTLIRTPNQAPFLTFRSGTSDYPLSITHTRNRTLLASLRNANPIGIDIEHQSRKVSDVLRNRILSQEEKLGLHLHKYPLIQLWTIKEAALKWAGSGLRTPMNSLTIAPESFAEDDQLPDHETRLRKLSGESRTSAIMCTVHFNDDKVVNVYSCVMDDYWVSIAFSRQDL